VDDASPDYAAIDADATLREALTRFLAVRGMAVDSGADRDSWYMGHGLLHVRLPNFGWRKRAIACHDAHHLLTGYPCTPAGEMQMAAWEFAAGRFPHIGATAFCLPLVGLGSVLLPRRTFAAFVRGRRNSTLYATTLSEEVLATRVADLRERFVPVRSARPTWQDRCAFARLVGWSFALMLAPVLLALVLASITWVVADAGRAPTGFFR
jgi:hypothetical protein